MFIEQVEQEDKVKQEEQQHLLIGLKKKVSFSISNIY